MSKLLLSIPWAALVWYMWCAHVLHTNVWSWVNSIQEQSWSILSISSRNLQNRGVNQEHLSESMVSCFQESGENADGLVINSSLPISLEERKNIWWRSILLTHVTLEKEKQVTIVNTDLASFGEDPIWMKRKYQFEAILKELEEYERVALCIDRNTIFAWTHESIAHDYGYTYTSVWNTWVLEQSEHTILRILGDLFPWTNGFPLDAVYVKWWDIVVQGTWNVKDSDHLAVYANISFNE